MDQTATPSRVGAAWRSMRALASAHRGISTIALLALLYGGWLAYAAITAVPTVTRYMITTVATDTVVAAMSETGQVSATNQIELDAKASGEVLAVYAKPGERVVAGQVIAAIDPTTANENVGSAAQALQAAQIALDKQTGPSVAHDTTYTDITSAVSDLNTVVTGLDGVLHDSTVPGKLVFDNEIAYRDLAPTDVIIADERAAESAYQIAATAYASLRTDAAATPRTANDAQLAALVKESYQTAAAVAEAAKYANSFLIDVKAALAAGDQPPPSTLAGHLSSLASFVTTANASVATLAADVAAGASTALDTQSSELSLQEKRDALASAQLALADTVVRAPFSGTIASVSVQPYQTIGNGAAVAVLTSDNQGVSLSVNEVDAAKLKVGQKATVTFDALPEVTLAGTVASINTVGTATQGVVSYGAVVSFDTPSSQVLPGMSATVDVITGQETGLVVPISAVKTVAGRSTVEVFNPPLPAAIAATTGTDGVAPPTAPTATPVTLGLSGDTAVIITSGLSAGDQIVTKTIAGISKPAAASAPSAASLLGGRAGGTSGGARALTR